MKVGHLIAAVILVSGAARAEQPKELPVDPGEGTSYLLVSGAGGSSLSLLDRAQAGGTFGATVSWQREVGQLRYGATALASSGRWNWAGGALDASWLLLEGAWTPYLGLGMGAFAVSEKGRDLSLRPALTLQAGLELFRDRAHRALLGVRALLPVTSQEGTGQSAHQSSRLDELGLLCEAGLTF